MSDPESKNEDCPESEEEVIETLRNLIDAIEVCRAEIAQLREALESK